MRTTRRQPRKAPERPWGRDTSSDLCAICGKRVASYPGEPRPWPRSWPTEIKLHGDATRVHRKCLCAIQNLRTDVVSGNIRERWESAPPLGSPRARIKEHQKGRRYKGTPTKSKGVFCGTVRPPPRIKRTGDSLAGKVKVNIPLPPENIFLKPKLYDKAKGNEDGASIKRKTGKGKSTQIITQRQCPQKPLVIPDGIISRPTTPQLVVVSEINKKKTPVVRVVVTEQTLSLSK